ncbi:MAG TPA: hypothetical protein VMG13_25820, partial [Trebonia sp.]|nr:hypothetical protein [Trebonia sp.]
MNPGTGKAVPWGVAVVELPDVSDDGPDRVGEPGAAVGEFTEPALGVRRHREDLQVVIDDQHAGAVGDVVDRGSAQGDADPQSFRQG